MQCAVLARYAFLRPKRAGSAGKREVIYLQAVCGMLLVSGIFLANESAPEREKSACITGIFLLYIMVRNARPDIFQNSAYRRKFWACSFERLLGLFSLPKKSFHMSLKIIFPPETARFYKVFLTFLPPLPINLR